MKQRRFISFVLISFLLIALVIGSINLFSFLDKKSPQIQETTLNQTKESTPVLNVTNNTIVEVISIENQSVSVMVVQPPPSCSNLTAEAKANMTQAEYLSQEIERDMNDQEQEVNDAQAELDALAEQLEGSFDEEEYDELSEAYDKAKKKLSREKQDLFTVENLFKESENNLTKAMDMYRYWKDTCREEK